MVGLIRLEDLGMFFLQELPVWRSSLLLRVEVGYNPVTFRGKFPVQTPFCRQTATTSKVSGIERLPGLKGPVVTGILVGQPIRPCKENYPPGHLNKHPLIPVKEIPPSGHV